MNVWRMDVGIISKFQTILLGNKIEIPEIGIVTDLNIGRFGLSKQSDVKDMQVQNPTV